MNLNYAGAVKSTTQAAQARNNVPPKPQVVDDDNDTFQGLLEGLQQIFVAKWGSMDNITAKVAKICHETLDVANIRHTISKRTKTWTSAEGSIRRKRYERTLRKQLRDTVVKSRKEDWDRYCLQSDLKSRETEPFASTGEMFDHLRDFGGVRISLYFPGAVDQISEILEKRFRVVPQTRKNQSMDVAMDLQRRMEKYKSSTSAGRTYTNTTERSFSGYKATHFCVRLWDKDIPADKKDDWKELIVEIQVGTMVMHAWSEIEHDMIYKPLGSEKISEDEAQLLDLINGIILTGESALRQLETSTKRRLNERTKDGGVFAMSHYELGYWLQEYWMERNNVKVEGDWEYLSQLYAILKATGDHQLGKVRQILSKIQTGETLPRRMLPMRILKMISEPSVQSWVPHLLATAHGPIPNEARLWATRLIHSLNMAMLLGVADKFFSSLESSSEKPLIGDILDIIHPTCPSYENAETAPRVERYCRGILQYYEKSVIELGRSGQHKKDLLHIAVRLATTGRVMVSSERGEAMAIPLQVLETFITARHAKSIRNESRDTARLSIQPWLSYIQAYVRIKVDEQADYVKMWDQMRLVSSETSATSTTDSWFLIPRRHNRIHEASWKLVTHALPPAVSASSNSSKESHWKRRNKFELEDSVEEDDILSLGFRLHPEKNWTKVYPAWKILKRSSKEDRSREPSTSSTSSRRSFRGYPYTGHSE